MHPAQLDTNTYLNQRRGVTDVTRRRETVYFVGAMLCALFNFLLILCLGAPSLPEGSAAFLLSWWLCVASVLVAVSMLRGMCLLSLSH